MRIAFLLALSAAAFTFYLNGPDIVTSHEARVALPAREMADAGWPWKATAALVPPVTLRPGIVRLAPDWNAPPIPVNPWLVPVMSGQVRLQKPPLPYWCAAICFRLFGGFSEITVRLVPALLGALAVLLIYDLGRVLYGRRIGWLAGLVWVSTYTLPDEYRKAMADPYLAFFTLACVWSWIRAVKADKSAGFLLAFYVSFAMALLAKGPPAFVDILLPLVVFHLCVRGRVRGPIRAHLAGVALMLAIALPWPIYVLRNVPHALELWRYESVGELTDNTENARPGWFYLPQLFYLALPWTAVWGLGIARQLFRGRELFDAWMRRRLLAKDQAAGRGFPIAAATGPLAPIEPANLRPLIARAQARHFFPIIWYGVMVVFFSFVHLKKNQYLLPMLPAQTLLIAQGFAVMFAGLHHRKFTGPPAWLATLQTVIGIAFAAAVIVLVAESSHANAASVALAAGAVALALLPFWALIIRREKAWAVLQATAFVAMIVIFGRVYITPSEDARSAKPVAAELLALSTQPGHTLLTMRLPEEVAVYLPLDVHFDFFAKHVLMIIDDQHGVRAREHSHRPIPEPNLTNVVPDGQVTEIRRVPLKTAPGDARWKVWEMTVERTATIRANPISPPAFAAGRSPTIN
ncbi:MAG TPA: glycosyltransferase family 39 protein [Tepidisphaeraceae bacterium]|nr:glycosyltransferase family 39 protein [Tepidisphaeraceae bacterium]